MMNPAQQPFVAAVTFVLVVQIPKLKLATDIDATIRPAATIAVIIIHSFIHYHYSL